jgi:hypothetical protein
VTGWALAAFFLAAGVRNGSAGAFLAGLGIAAGNGVSLYFWPFAPCWSCNGSGRNRGSNRKRYGECRRCKGTGRRQRPGSRLVHRGAVSLAEKARKKGTRP